MRHLISVQEPIETQAADGSVVQAWSDYVVARASIEPLSGREYFSAQAEASSVSHRIRMRYVAGVTTKMRVVFDEREFEIESVINYEERNRELILMCEEGTE
jgi:SPP1 family predicted phage head-tail adaptor